MKRTNSKKPRAETARGSNPFQIRASGGHAHGPESEVHVIGPGVICDTEKRGYATPHNRDPAEIVVDASEGFIPLWAKDMTLRWRFQERSMEFFEDPEAAKAEIERLVRRGPPGLGRRGARQVRQAGRRLGLRDRDERGRPLHHRRVRPGERLLPRRGPTRVAALSQDVRPESAKSRWKRSSTRSATSSGCGTSSPTSARRRGRAKYSERTTRSAS